MKEFLNSISTREVSLLFWTVITAFIIFRVILLKPTKEVIESFKDVIHAFIKKEILLSLILLLVYVSLIIYGLYKVKFWNIGLLKDSILWTFGIGIPMLYNLNKANKSIYYKDVVKDTLKWMIIIEFITDFYTFDLWIELIIVPIMTFFILVRDISNNKLQYSSINNVSNKAISNIGIALLFFIVYKVLTSINSLLTIDNLKSFFTPIFLTFLFLPFMYFFALYAEYECLFNQISLFIKDKRKKKEIKTLVFRICLFSIRKVNNILTLTWNWDRPNLEEYLTKLASRGKGYINEVLQHEGVI